MVLHAVVVHQDFAGTTNCEIKCGLNCGQCDLNGKCISCQSGYVLNDTSGVNYCVKCPDNCGSCDIIETKTNCTFCQASFKTN
jgi:hypothetical protein